MGKRIFGSNAEKHNFRHLQQVWGEKWHIYPNQPFRNFVATKDVLDLSEYGLPSLNISAAEKEQLNKTSVDYVLCTPEDEVLLGIEFDGIGEGFSHGTTYVPARKVCPDRARMMNLKLRVANASGTPFVVVGTQDFAPLGPGCNLSIVDGIIGRVLAGRARQRKFSVEVTPEMLGIDRDAFEERTPQEQYLLLEDYAVGVEVMTDMEHDVLEREACKRKRQLDARGWMLSFPSSADGLAECAVEVQLCHGSSVSSHVRIRDFDSDSFLMASLLENVATLSALLKAKPRKGVA